MNWRFAIVNNKLAEIYFDEDRTKVWGHCYVRKEDYATRQEQKWIARDTKKGRFICRNKKYRFVPTGN